MPMARTAVILAAGFGTRMKSALPKALHRIAGRPMLRHLLAACEQAFDRIVVVVGPEMEAVCRAAEPHATVVQHDRRGTAHAALAAAPLFGDGEVAVLYADNPLIRPATLHRLLDRRAAGDAAMALLAFRPSDPARYGRVVAHEGYVERIVEWIDAVAAERAEVLCNAGVLCAASADMARWLAAVRADNAKGEYYLTDVVALARAEGGRVAAVEAPADEVAGINSRAELAAAEAAVQSRLRRAAMDAGVTMTDPGSVFLCADSEFSPDVTIEPNVVFGPGVKVASGAVIRAFSHLEGCAVGPGCIVGPYARLRPGTELGRERPHRQLRRGEGIAPGRRGEGEPPDLSRRRGHRRGSQHRRRHHHLQLRRPRQAPHHDRGARLHRLGHRAGRAGDGGRRRHHGGRQRDHRGRARGRAGDRARAAGDQAGARGGDKGSPRGGANGGHS